MVLQERCIKEIYENFCFGNKSARNERVLEIIDWNRSIVKTHYLIDLQIAFFNFLFSSSIFSKSTKSEKTIFLISRGKMGSVEILFDVFYFYAISRLFFSELFLEFQIEILEAVTLDKWNILWLFNDSYNPTVIKRNGHWNNGVWSVDVFLSHQVVEDRRVLFEFQIRLIHNCLSAWLLVCQIIMIIFIVIFNFRLTFIKFLVSPANVSPQVKLRFAFPHGTCLALLPWFFLSLAKIVTNELLRSLIHFIIIII